MHQPEKFCGGCGGKGPIHVAKLLFRQIALRGPWRPAAGVLERASRRARLRLDAHLSRREWHAGRDHPAPGRTPKGTEARIVVEHVTKRLRQYWPHTRMVWRGDSHYGRVEAMEWAENDGADYIFGLPGNAMLDALVADRSGPTGNPVFLTAAMHNRCL
jgi:hypothetical protein